ncbi:MAG: T9SS type A sorting domain-containing protein [Candidatus Cloacimonetes bacterium]|nr:T9SS type A sorting domain-containing protein [Candidatus Cloacimonadota bacterium]
MKNTLMIACLLLVATLFAQTGGPDEFGYTWANSNAAGGPTYEWIDHANGTQLQGVSDDWVSGQIPLGFDFPFYGQIFDYIHICSNGILGFNTSNITHYQNQSIPSTNTPNNIIAWFWDDLNPTYAWAQAEWYYEQVDYNGQSAFLVTAINMPEYNNGGSYPNNCFQGQALLIEDGSILIQYDWFGSAFDIGNASVGIENSNGSIGLQYCFHNASMIENDLAILYYAPGPAFDNDLAVTELLGSPFPSLDIMEIYPVTVENMGALDQSDYSVQLVDETGEVLAESNGSLLVSGESDMVLLLWTPDEIGPVFLVARVVLATDENPDNDESAPLDVEVLTPDVTAATVGDEAAPRRIPLDFYYKASLCETLYYPEELGLDDGLLTTLAWQASFFEPCWDKPVRVWVGETTLPDLSLGWVCADELNLVYDGLLDVPAGQGLVWLPLQSFYEYQGGTLVVMIERMLDDAFYSSENIFLATDTANYPARTRRWQSDVEAADPNDPADGQLADYLPNTHLFFTTGPVQVLVRPLSTEGVVWEGLQVSLASADTTYEAFTTLDTGAQFDDVVPGWYSLTVIGDGFVDYFEDGLRIVSTCVIERTLTSLPVNDGEATPFRTALAGASPNPFNPSTSVRFSLAVAGVARLSVYDVRGRLVRVLATEHRQAGEYVVVWDGRNDNGRTCASGVYLLRLQAGEKTLTTRALLLK